LLHPGLFAEPFARGISMHAERNFGRRYVVAWDDEVARYHVTLGRDSIGFHKTREGAKAVARARRAGQHRGLGEDLQRDLRGAQRRKRRL